MKPASYDNWIVANAAYIAAANPASISSILDALEGLERERDDARKLLSEAASELRRVSNDRSAYDTTDEIMDKIREHLK